MASTKGDIPQKRAASVGEHPELPKSTEFQAPLQALSKVSVFGEDVGKHLDLARRIGRNNPLESLKAFIYQETDERLLQEPKACWDDTRNILNVLMFDGDEKIMSGQDLVIIKQSNDSNKTSPEQRKVLFEVYKAARKVFYPDAPTTEK